MSIQNSAAAAPVHGHWMAQIGSALPTRRFNLVAAEYLHSCARCGTSDGQVYLIRDGTKSYPLHEGCAIAFFGRDGSVRMSRPSEGDDRDDPDAWQFNREDE